MNEERTQRVPTRLDDVEHRAPDERIACAVIRQAIQDGASEIHVEPLDQQVRVSFRLGEKMPEVMSLPKYMNLPLTVRFKSMANLDLSSRDSHQQGDMWVRTEGKGYRLTLTTTPGEYGENLLIRLPV